MRFNWNKWAWSALWAVLLLLLFGWWHAGFDGFVINKAFADAAYVLMGMSFALSGICHFCKINKWLAHRKYLGLQGFYFLIVHAVLSLVLFGIRHFFKPVKIVPFLFALTSTLFFAWLAIISTTYWMRRLKQNWRKWLRAGYIAFVFGTVHFFILYWRSWSYWSFQGFPEPSLVMAFFGVLVLLLRLVLYLKVKK